MVTSSVTNLGHGHYYIHSGVQVFIAASASPELQPATIIRLPNATATQEEIDAKIAWFEQVDDVFHRDFLQVALVYRPLDACDQKQLLAILSRFGTRELHCLGLSRPDNIPEGPYFIQSQTLYQTWRLHENTYDAFYISIIQSNDGSNVHLPVNASSPGRHLAIAVPSRLHYPSSVEKPLNGLHLAVKDNIDLRGVRTSRSSRSYFNTYPAAETSAPAIQKLIDIGAVVVGKTGLSQFADAEDPTGDYIDYHCAFNSRGDGYRSPGGSSSGSGAAVAAYEWLDLAIGTDTGGSVRVPASYQGVFGLRTSRGALSLDGSLIIHRNNTSGTPKRILYPTHLFPIHDPVGQEVYDNIVSSAEKALGIAREEVDFRVLWRDHSSSFTTDSYEEYFHTSTQSLGIGEIGKAMTEDDMKTAKKKREIFQRFIECVFSENTIMFTPFMFEEPGSRDAYRLKPSDRDPAELALGLRPAFQTPFSRQPEMVFPVGLISTEDTMSGRA
ncbi:hypothetical protein ZTR_00100 [Talaromyces verruculosus]|nr:hypothetical protein ZTR_00100 [Talaromyces verruculosus]